MNPYTRSQHSAKTREIAYVQVGAAFAYTLGMSTLPRVLLVLNDPHVERVARRALGGRFEVHSQHSPDDALQAALERPYAAVIWDRTAWGRAAGGFVEALQHVAPGARIMDLSHHLSPHLATLERLRPDILARWGAPSTGNALLDAMMASADDPIMIGPHTN